MRTGTFHEVPVVLATSDWSFDGHVEIGYRIRLAELAVNPGDQVRHVVHLRRTEEGRFLGSFFFVCPYESGDYCVEQYAMDGGERRPLRLKAGGEAAFHVEVKDSARARMDPTMGDRAHSARGRVLSPEVAVRSGSGDLGP